MQISFTLFYIHTEWTMAIIGEREGVRGNIEVGEGRKGYYRIVWNQLCDTLENCKTLTLSFNKKII